MISNSPITLSVSSSSASLAVIEKWCCFYGVAFGVSDSAIKHNELRIETVSSLAERYTYITETNTVSDEIFQLNVQTHAAGYKVVITHSGDRSLWYALNKLVREYRMDKLETGISYHYPLFKFRSIIEGFYGPPWSQDQRIEMLRFISGYNMNAFFYGPKDDIYHRRKWREEYDHESYGKLKELFTEASENYLDFYYCIAPGLSMRYSSKEDMQDLIAKIKHIYQLGVRNFGLLFDDIPEVLQHKEDQEVYVDLVAAHLDVSERLYKELKQFDASIRLVVCPTQYYGKGNEYYISKLGSQLHPNIDLFWTGRNICSQEITLQEAAIFTQSTYHKPLYWDNYPVNDVEMSDEMHIGPYRGRDKHLYRFSRGVVANTMEYAESSKIAIATIADYLWDPLSYEPELSWKQAITRIVGQRDEAAFQIFADQVLYSCLYQRNAPQLGQALEKFPFEYEYGNRTEALVKLSTHIKQMDEASKSLLKDMDNKSLQQEVARWLSKFAQGCTLLIAGLDCLAKRDEANVLHFRKLYNLFKANPTYVFGDVMDAYANLILEQ